MAKKESLQEIKEFLPKWDFLQNLPEEIQGFKLLPGGKMLDQHVLLLCSYEKPGTHRSLDLIYTKETFDYLPVKQVGFHRFRDLRYITRDKDVFASLITEVLPRMLMEIDEDYEPPCQVVLERKGIKDWTYCDSLPKKIGNFELFISRKNPLQFINNSIIILNYVDFINGKELAFFYNRVRNEFFAESMVDYIPATIHDFDSKTLEGLEKLLDKKLRSYLENM